MTDEEETRRNELSVLKDNIDALFRRGGVSLLAAAIYEERQIKRAATIEACAKVAEAWFEKEFAGTLGSEGIGKAVRSLKSVPMDKEG